MIAVIFEVQPKAGQHTAYLEIAQSLRAELDRIDGFVSIERFQSLNDPSRLLSLSFWRDEAAIAEWRRLSQHRAAQSAGRATVFEDYRLRVAGVIRDYGMCARDQAPADARAHHG